MRPHLLALAAELSRRGEAFALVSVVRREAPSSARLGDSALITARGEFHGWLGGSCTRPTAVREALAAIRDGTPRVIALSPDPARDSRADVRPILIACHSGGRVDLYIEPVVPAPCLVVYGGSPVAQAAVRIAAVLGYTTLLLDADDGAAPGAAGLADIDRSRLFALVATHGERDEEALREALALSPAYVGLVASRTRSAKVREVLLARGVSREQLDRVHGPAGIDIGAAAPEEIALSVIAEIVRTRRAAAAAPAPAPAAAQRRVAVDPICHMEVDIATAKHKAEVGGETWYFCCGGCREEFLTR
jgi:xanthine dehydrogenase accessory factor